MIKIDGFICSGHNINQRAGSHDLPPPYHDEGNSSTYILKNISLVPSDTSKLDCPLAVFHL